MIDDTLEEELLEEFKGGTLTINPENKPNYDKLIRTGLPDKNPDMDAPKEDNKYWGTSLISPFTSIHNKITATLWSSNNKSPPKPSTPIKDNASTLQQAICITENPNNFFTFRESVLAQAICECKEQFLDDEADGPLIEAFLLTQISNWNSDKERLVLLTPNSLVVAKYDFIALKRLGYKKLPLDMVDEVVVGGLVYPSGSLIPNRHMKGIRLVWNKKRPLNFSTQWNPFNDEVPYCTFTFHPLFFHKACTEEKLKNLYNLELFIEKLCKALSDLPRNNNVHNESCIIQEKDIILPSYVGIGSVIHNRNSLGFFKVRGKFSF